MIITRDFKTRNEMSPRQSVSPDGYWPVGLDIGYSSVKGWTPNKIFCFPSYAKRIKDNEEFIKMPDDMDIQYKDPELGRWVVGKLAYDEVVASDVVDNETELYGRNRYHSPMFQVITRTGLALSMLKNQNGGIGDRKICIQTGLPPSYLSADSEDLIASICGTFDFELKIGHSDWQKFHIVIDRDNICPIMTQPKGALMSVTIAKDGSWSPESVKYLQGTSLIFDPGFGTCDTYLISKGRVADQDTDPALAMREVFARTCRKIKDDYGINVQIAELQNRLDSGVVDKTDKKNMIRDQKDFSRLLEESSNEVLTETVEHLKSVYNYFENIDFIIATGGTYEAWRHDFDAVFKNMSGLKIVPANINDPQVSNVYSNVRGYYYQCVHSIQN